MKKIVNLLVSVLFVLSSAGSVSAHVGIKPEEVRTGVYQIFSVTVPNHKNVTNEVVRLIIPEELTDVTPYIKPGWSVETLTDGQHVMPDGTVMDDAAVQGGGHMEDDGHHVAVREIIWRGEGIPEGLGDEFKFSAKTPENETTLTWKAYQSFSDGTTQSWELGPDEDQPLGTDGKPDYTSFGPASTTNVANATRAEAAAEKKSTEQQVLIGGAQKTSSNAMIIAGVAIVIAGVSFAMQFTNKKKK